MKGEGNQFVMRHSRFCPLKKAKAYILVYGFTAFAEEPKWFENNGMYFPLLVVKMIQ
jgi:hypothetical protein